MQMKTILLIVIIIIIILENVRGVWNMYGFNGRKVFAHPAGMSRAADGTLINYEMNLKYLFDGTILGGYVEVSDDVLMVTYYDLQTQAPFMVCVDFTVQNYLNVLSK